MPSTLPCWRRSGHAGHESNAPISWPNVGWVGTALHCTRTELEVCAKLLEERERKKKGIHVQVKYKQYRSSSSSSSSRHATTTTVPCTHPPPYARAGYTPQELQSMTHPAPSMKTFWLGFSRSHLGRVPRPDGSASRGTLEGGGVRGTARYPWCRGPCDENIRDLDWTGLDLAAAETLAPGRGNAHCTAGLLASTRMTTTTQQQHEHRRLPIYPTRET